MSMRRLWEFYQVPVAAASVAILSTLAVTKLYSISSSVPSSTSSSSASSRLLNDTSSIRTDMTSKSEEDLILGAIKSIHKSCTMDGNIDHVLDIALESLKLALKTEKVHILITGRNKSKYFVRKLIDIDVNNDPSRGIAQLSYNNRKCIVISDCESVSRLNLKVSTPSSSASAASSPSTSTRTSVMMDSIETKTCECNDEMMIHSKNIICAPILIDNKTIIGVIYALDIDNQLFDEDGQSPNRSAVDIFELFMDNITIAIQHSLLLSKTTLENKRSSALLSILRMRSSDGSLDKLLQVAIDAVDKVISPQLVSIYLCDQSRREIFICASKDGMEGLTISYGQGVAGYAAANMETVRIDDAYGDSRFLPTVDKFTGSITQSILCVPVPGFANSSPIALIQVINKTQGCFDEEDEETLTLLAQELSIGLRMRAREIYALKTLGQRTFDNVSLSILEESLLQDYGSIAYRYKYRVVGDKIVLGPISPPETTPSSRRATYYGYSSTCQDKGNNNKNDLLDDDNRIGKFTITEAMEAINKYSFDPFLQTDDDLIDLAVYMFRSYNLFETIHMDVAIFHRFVCTIHSLYHPNNSFHNFKHGWSVMHLTYHILRGGADQYLTTLDIAALLVAAMCHDVDHTGFSNNFEIATRSPLAMLYCDDTVLERHHAATTNRILSSKEFDFLPYLSSNDKKSFRKTITTAIFATDMGKHFEMVERLMGHTVSEPPFDKSDSECRLELVRYVIHCADIGAQTQDSTLALKWTERCIAEFSYQADREMELVLDPTPYMVGLKDDELKCMQLQHGFIVGIVLPLWSSLVECLPKLSTSIDRLLENKQYYSDRMEMLQAERGLTSSPSQVSSSSSLSTSGSLCSSSSSISSPPIPPTPIQVRAIRALSNIST